MAPRTQVRGDWQRLTEGSYRLGGPLVIGSVTRLREQALADLATGSGDICIDLADVAPVDSAGLALLVDLLAWAHGARRSLRYTGATAPMRAMARISELEPLLDSR